MGIELQKAKEKLDMIEKLANNPELILTDLYSKGLSDSNFFYQVHVKGKYLLEYLTDYLEKQSVFNNTIIKLDYHKLNIYIPSLKRKPQEFQQDDKIMKIDIEKRTYVLCDDFLEKYKRIMNANYELELCELSDFWKQFEDLSFKNRIKNTFKELGSKHKLNVKLSNFLFFLIVREKTVQPSLDKEKKRIDDKNKHNLDIYNSNIELQKFYNKKAPDQIKKGQVKQKELKRYFSNLGFKEDKTMDKY